MTASVSLSTIIVIIRSYLRRICHCSGSFGRAEGSGLPPSAGGNISDPRQKTNDTNSTTVCSEDFFLDSGVCKPQCGQWKEFPHSTVVATDAVVIVSTSIGFIVANTLLVLSCIRYKKV